MNDFDNVEKLIGNYHKSYPPIEIHTPYFHAVAKNLMNLPFPVVASMMGINDVEDGREQIAILINTMKHALSPEDFEATKEFTVEQMVEIMKVWSEGVTGMKIEPDDD